LLNKKKIKNKTKQQNKTKQKMIKHKRKERNNAIIREKKRIEKEKQ
jgi:hypothetical protein